MTILFGLFEFNFYNFEYTFNSLCYENKYIQVDDCTELSKGEPSNVQIYFFRNFMP